MTKEVLEERIRKTEETISKKEKLLERYYKKIDKISSSNEYENEEWRECDLEGCKDDIKRTERSISEKKELLEKYKGELNKVNEDRNIYDKYVPESMKEMVKELESQWNIWDKERREFLSKEYKKLGYNKMRESDESIEKNNKRDADLYVMDLWNRINEKTGEVRDWSGIHCVGVALNGVVEGDKGKVEVRTILAGGYNIQRLHCRTLVLGFG